MICSCMYRCPCDEGTVTPEMFVADLFSSVQTEYQSCCVGQSGIRGVFASTWVTQDSIEQTNGQLHGLPIECTTKLGN